jgi:hypothetical protein
MGDRRDRIGVECEVESHVESEVKKLIGIRSKSSMVGSDTKVYSIDD